MKYFKIILGYGPEDVVQIDQTELEKAFYVFLTGKKAILGGMPVNGDRIITIRPDYHRAMGWNQGYKLGPEDHAELSREGVDTVHTALLDAAKETVQHLIMTSQTDRIGKGFEVAKLGSPASDAATQLANEKRV